MSVIESLSLDEEFALIEASHWAIAPVSKEGLVWGKRRQIAHPPSTSTVTWLIPSFATTLASIRLYRDGEYVKDTEIHSVRLYPGGTLIVTYDLLLA